jgi:hypothetical protein
MFRRFYPTMVPSSQNQVSFSSPRIRFLGAFAPLMKMQLVTATSPHENRGKSPPVLRPAPFAKGGHWGICRRCSHHGTSFSCAVLYRLAHELLCGKYSDQLSVPCHRTFSSRWGHAKSTATAHLFNPNASVCGSSAMGRTSTQPKRAPGIFAATWIASFRSLASIT